MNKYKITGIDGAGDMVAEIKEETSFPQIYNPYYTMMGIPITVLKIEIVLEANKMNIADTTTND